MDIEVAAPHAVGLLPLFKHLKSDWQCENCLKVFTRRLRDILNSPSNQVLCTSCTSIQAKSKFFISQSPWIKNLSSRNIVNFKNITKSERTIELLWTCVTCSSDFLRTPHNMHSSKCDNCRRLTRFSILGQVAEAWISELNGELPTSLYALDDQKRYYWRCSICASANSRSVRTIRTRKSPFVCNSCTAKTTAQKRTYSPVNRSKGEKELYDFIKTFVTTEVIHNLKAFEVADIDIYIPARKLAIEYNGEYWHSDLRAQEMGFKSATIRHRQKLELLSNAGVTLAFVWEHDWLQHNGSVTMEIKNFIRTGSKTSMLSKLEATSKSMCVSCKVTKT